MGFQTYTCAICGKSELSRRNTYALPDGKGRACRSHEESQAANNERIAKRDQAIADAVKKSCMDLKGFKTEAHTTPHEHKDLDYLNKLFDLCMIGMSNATMVHLILRDGFNFLEDKRKQPTPWMDRILDQLRDYSKRILAAKHSVDEYTFLHDVKHVIYDGLKHYKEVKDSPRKDFSEIPEFASELLSMKLLIHTEIAAGSTEDISTVIEHRFNKLVQMVADALAKYSNSKDEFSLQWQMLTDLAELLWTLSHETPDSESDEPSVFIKTFAWANSVKKTLTL